MGLNLNIRFKGMDSSDAVRSYLTERCEKLEKYLPPSTVLNASIEKDKEREIVELNFHHKGNDYFAKEVTESIYSAIDLVTDKIKRQLSRRKDKRTDRTPTPGVSL